MIGRHQVAGKRALALALGDARSQGKGHKVNTGGIRGLALRSGFPLAAERPLYSELIDTRRYTATRTLLTDIAAWNPPPPLRAAPSLPPFRRGSSLPSVLPPARLPIWSRDGCGARLPLSTSGI